MSVLILAIAQRGEPFYAPRKHEVTQKDEGQKGCLRNVPELDALHFRKVYRKEENRASNGLFRESGCWGEGDGYHLLLSLWPPKHSAFIVSCFFCCYLCVPKAMITKRLDLDLNLGSLIPEPARFTFKELLQKELRPRVKMPT